jgi:DNA-binding PucR family transcriptional regulator
MIKYVYIFELNKDYESMIDEIVDASGHVERSFYHEQGKVYVFDAFVEMDTSLLIQTMMSETLTNIDAYASYSLKASELDTHLHTLNMLTNTKKPMVKGVMTDHDLLKAYHGTYHPKLKPFILKKYANQHVMEASVIMYLNHNQNMSVAAKELYVHRNTLITRLEKFHEVTGFDMKTFYDAYLMYDLLHQKGH